MRSMGFEAHAAREPESEPAAIFLTMDLFSFVSPSRVLTGP